jgi:hypothetical protein
VQGAFRQVFARWGLPERLQADNGLPWGCNGGLPSPLARWLVGLGIDVRWSRPRVPQDNGVVERSMRTGKAWANPGKCRTPAEVQARLDEADRIQREEYPASAGRARLAVWPELAHSRRAYRRRRESASWSLEAALARLGCFVVVRRVSRRGKVSLYDRPYHVGVSLADQDLLVQFSPERAEWIVSDSRDRQVRALPATTLTRKNIVTLLEL